MAIPDFQSLMLPVLRLCETGAEWKISEVVKVLAERLALTEAERAQLLPSGRQGTFVNRVSWAKVYLGMAGLIEKTRRAHFRITESGRRVLSENPGRIDIRFLKRFPGFTRRREGGAPSQAAPVPAESAAHLTPDETIREVAAGLDEDLATELLARACSASPDFFERIVVRLLLAMGYGGSADEAGRALGRSGDGGVDGVIYQDPLGMDRIYVQAKRYADGNPVGPAAIRDFFGALDRYKAAKGLFVTTSSFSPAARETAEFLSKRIVLLDGRQFARLLIRYEVGCRVEEVVRLKKIDEDFFE